MPCRARDISASSHPRGSAFMAITDALQNAPAPCNSVPWGFMPAQCMPCISRCGQNFSSHVRNAKAAPGKSEKANGKGGNDCMYGPRPRSACTAAHIPTMQVRRDGHETKGATIFRLADTDIVGSGEYVSHHEDAAQQLSQHCSFLQQRCDCDRFVCVLVMHDQQATPHVTRHQTYLLFSREVRHHGGSGKRATTISPPCFPGTLYQASVFRN